MRPSSTKTLFRLHLFGWVFTPKLWPTVAVLLLLPLFISLGMWQLSRAAYKEQLQRDLQARRLALPLSLRDVQAPLTQQEFRWIKLTGKYDNAHQLLLDNQMYQHHVGYQVLTPFYVEGNQQPVLVNRGWIPLGKTRQILPVLPPLLGTQTIIGMIKLPPRKTFVLSSDTTLTQQWPAVIEALDLKQITTLLNQPVHPFVVLLSPNNSGGFVCEWEMVTMSAEKHYGYAWLD